MQQAIILEKKAPIIYEGEDAIKKLHEFDISFEDVEFFVTNAVRDFNALPKYVFSMERNTKVFFSMIRHFRDRMLKKGWSYDDKYNLNKTISQNKKTALIFSSGDCNVCSLENTPMTKNKKGEVSLAVIEMNNCVQLSMLKELFPYDQFIQEKYDIGEFPHWFFLFHKVKNRVRIELSLPEEIDGKTRKIIQWAERIILPEIDLRDEPPEQSFEISAKKSSYDKEEALGITRKAQG